MEALQVTKTTNNLLKTIKCSAVKVPELPPVVTLISVISDLRFLEAIKFGHSKFCW